MSENPLVDLPFLTSEPKKTPGIDFQTKELSEINDDDVRGIEEFVKRETESARSYRDSKDADKDVAAQRIAAQSRHALTGFKRILDREGYEGSVVVARENDEIVGFGVATLAGGKEDPDRARLYFGCAWDKSRRGIGTGILREELRVLKEKGVNTYTEEVWQGSKNAYDRFKALGLSYSFSERYQGSEYLLVDISNLNLTKSVPRSL